MSGACLAFAGQKVLQLCAAVWVLWAVAASGLDPLYGVWSLLPAALFVARGCGRLQPYQPLTPNAPQTVPPPFVYGPPQKPLAAPRGAVRPYRKTVLDQLVGWSLLVPCGGMALLMPMGAAWVETPSHVYEAMVPLACVSITGACLAFGNALVLWAGAACWFVLGVALAIATSSAGCLAVGILFAAPLTARGFGMFQSNK